MVQNDFDGSRAGTPYVYQAFPRMLYHDSHPSRIVADQVALDIALAAGWRTTVLADTPPPVTTTPPVVTFRRKRGRPPKKVTA
jgi:hypothetical protein